MTVQIVSARIRAPTRSWCYNWKYTWLVWIVVFRNTRISRVISLVGNVIEELQNGPHTDDLSRFPLVLDRCPYILNLERVCLGRLRRAAEVGEPYDIEIVICVRGLLSP